MWERKSGGGSGWEGRGEGTDGGTVVEKQTGAAKDCDSQPRAPLFCRVTLSHQPRPQKWSCGTTISTALRPFRRVPNFSQTRLV